MTEPGPHNSLVDVVGLRVGHHQRQDDGYLTGTTVVLAPAGGMVAGVDVRGGAPGTRETDLLDPTASMQVVQAIVLTGGSAYGLAAADGAMGILGELGIGFPVGDQGDVVPIVPAAVIFDLGRGGRFNARPDAAFGAAAVTDADAEDDQHSPAPWSAAMGNIGAGLGAATAGMKGGLGTASARLPGGFTVAATMVVNASGSPVDPQNGELLGARLLLPGDVPGLGIPDTEERDRVNSIIASAGARLREPAAAAIISNTTIGVIATDALLTKAQCTKLASIGHDGIARAINPVHTGFDGDTLFAVSTGTAGRVDDLGFYDILCAAADVVTRAIVRGLVSAVSVTTSAGSWRSYADVAPSAFTLAPDSDGLVG